MTKKRERVIVHRWVQLVLWTQRERLEEVLLAEFEKDGDSYVELENQSEWPY